MMIYNTFFVFTILCCSVLGAKLPSDFKICKRGDLSVLPECLKSAIQSALPKMRNGLPDLKIGKLEPLVISSAQIGEGKGAVNVAQNYKNFKIYGISDSIVDSVNFTISDDQRSCSLNLKAHSPEYRFEADYKLSGRVLLLPVVGDGQCNVTSKNINVEIYTHGELYEKKGKDYMRATTVDIKLNPGLVTYYFGNLFNGDKVLGDRINTLLNDNWKEIYEDVREGYESLFGSVVLNYINGVYSKFPFNELFPN